MKRLLLVLAVVLAAGAAAGIYWVSAARAHAFYIYTTNEEEGSVTVIDGVTETVVATIQVGKRPRGIHLSPDGKTAYVTLSGSPMAGPGVDELKLPPADKKADGIGVIDLVERKLVGKLPSGSDPEQFDITRDGAQLVISNEDAASASILDIKTSTILATLPVGAEPEGVTLDSANAMAYITSEEEGAIYAIDVRARKNAGSLKVGPRPRNVAIMPDGVFAYVPSELSAKVYKVKLSPLEVVKIIDTPGPQIRPMGMVISADGKRLYVTTGHGGKVLEIDTATDTIVRSVDVGKRPWGIALSADGKKLYTANGPSNDLSVVDVERLEVIKRIPVGRKPWGIAVGK